MNGPKRSRLAAWHRWVLVAIAIVAVLLLLVGKPAAGAALVF